MPKGRDAEKYVRDRLEDAGYQTYLPPLAKWREQDVFSLFDILAFGHGRLIAIQVKGGQTATGINSWFHDARTFEEDLVDLQLLFVHCCGQDLRVARLTADGWEWVVDERDKATTYPSSFETIVR